jgi:hypothetical protein
MESKEDQGNNIKVFSFYHKDATIILRDDVNQPLMVGGANQKNNCRITGDDTGENISSKNKYYCELTGIFWVWKNTQSDVTGACHYRRYFTAKPEPVLYKIKRLLYFPIGLYKRRYGLIYTGNTSLFIPRIINKKEIEDLLSQYDAILPQARKLNYSVEVHYQRYHSPHDLSVLKSILAEKYPDYLPAFQQVFQSKRLYANNMFILKNNHYQEFMNWWFDILFEFEKRVDLSRLTGYQTRIIGFISERLLNVWFKHKNLKVAELPVIYFKKLKL